MNDRAAAAHNDAPVSRDAGSSGTPATVPEDLHGAPVAAATARPPAHAPACGSSPPHESARAQLLGGAPYVDDLPEPRGTLHAAPILSPVAHGTLKGIDASAARAMTGVRALITAADIPGDPVLATFVHDEPVFATDVVQHVGQVVGLIVADTVQAARHAARQVQLDIAPLPPILTIEQAMAAQSFVLPTVTVTRGDPPAALAASPHRLQGQFAVGGQEHFYLEGQIALAVPREQDQWHITSSTQHPGEVQHWVAHALGIASHRVTVECRRMGGGFGGKETQAGHMAVWAALAALKTRAPVKLRLDRDDDFLITGKRHPFAYDYDVGFDDAGRITALQLDMMANCGFSADLSGPVCDRAVFHADNAYFLSDVVIRSYRCKTHLQSHTAFRGFGGPQGVIVIETILGDIARALGKDALDVRMVNLYDGRTSPPPPLGESRGEGRAASFATAQPLTPTLSPAGRGSNTDAAPDSLPLPPAGEGRGEGAAPERRDTTPYQMRVEDNILPDLLPKLELLAQYRRRQEAISAWNSNNQHLKRGIAITPVKFGISFTATLFNQAGALVHVYTDGSVQVNHGGTEMGQGLHTKVAQVVADELGVPLSQVLVTGSATDKVPNASATAASSGTDLNGKAAQAAARTVRDNLAAFVCGLDGCGAGAVEFTGGQVITPKTERAFADVVKAAYANRIQLWSDGFYRTPKIHYDKTTLTGRPFFYFAYGAACSEVAIDTLTGEYRVLAVDILHDVGRSIHPAIDIGQIEGGFIQGMGWLTTEELVWDDKGQLTTKAPSTYKIPTAGDVPPRFNVHLWPEPNDEDTVFRSKAVGEPPFMLAISVWEALRQAVAAARADGKPVQMDAPATPERVLRAMGGLP
ncbi:molybdopterin cofactor-binding domain-containing protein [Ottowia sp.]|uniref:xanthine dehydrogenase molybdopterin binding subunit n=1 Tax=Ottowia sp. TaxID=1898956 RepID=UPI002BDB060D|nr:molybdopterin cofactor-binding domain-containing protein [Ottowia sp.]HOB65209.1 molybdopterin-dependent oxidoreductase [Ottowia sp.]HPZ58203.1 molybdopterin-dependent oxidoreductase [Ottowia sp.]HQD49117.1 molybdopterin-dependent oxidoreductase [Ottowia sp.]